MLQWLRKRSETGRRAGELYGSVVTAARQAPFYGTMGVPDTPEGRYELIALHLFLALQSLRDAAGNDLRQRTIEAFVVDMDDCMREMGIGDLAVPKKVKRAAAGFYERATIYQRGLTDVDGDGLTHGLRRYIFADDENRLDASAALAHYVRAASSALTAQPFDVWVANGSARRLLDTVNSTAGMTAT
ncbi:MAG: ubiquinol-cytochrome C chaperone family protein [Hyphomicrobium sp.]